VQQSLVESMMAPSLLKDIAALSAGYQFRGAIKPSEAGNASVVQMSNVQRDGRIQWDALATVMVKQGTEGLRDDDILFVARGTDNYAIHVPCLPQIQPQIQSPAHVQTRVQLQPQPQPPPQPQPKPQGCVVLSPHFLRLRVTSPLIRPAFLAWQLNQLTVQARIHAVAVGSAQRALSAGALRQFNIVLPTLEKQDRVLALYQAQQQERALLSRLLDSQQQIMNQVARQILQAAPTTPSSIPRNA
jgi:hypothetical protein